MGTHLKRGIGRVILYELELPLSAADWCKANSYHPARIQDEIHAGHIVRIIVLQFTTRRSARRAARRYDIAHGLSIEGV